MNTIYQTCGVALSTSFIVSFSIGAAWADCTTSGSTTTCTGDVTSVSDTDIADTTNVNDIYNYEFKNLSSNLTAGSGLNYGIDLGSTGVEGSSHDDDSTSGRTIHLTFDGAFASIDVTGNAISMHSTGGKGHSGNSNGSATSTSSHSGGNGVNGGWGGGLTTFWNSGSIYGSQVIMSSTGGDGGEGGEGQSDTGNGTGGNGGTGGEAYTVRWNNGKDAYITTKINSLTLEGTGGTGGQGGEGFSGDQEAKGGKGGQGGVGAEIDVTLTNPLAMSVVQAGGPVTFEMKSTGGDGGHGGNAHGNISTSKAGNGGLGGHGGDITFDGSLQDLTIHNEFGTTALLAVSQAGRGGHGGNGSSGGSGKGGDGGEGGDGGDVVVDLSNLVNSINNTAGQDAEGGSSIGVLAQSFGGAGGNGGDGSGGLGSGKGGGGGGGGNAGLVTVNLGGTIKTAGYESEGILGQSIAGLAGASGSASGTAGYGASSQSGGDSAGGMYNLLSTSSITTSGDYSTGLHGQSIGGGGGRGSSTYGVVSLGGDGSAGGNGGSISLDSAGAVTTSGDHADGLSLQTIGGSGGAAGSAHGLTAIGGDAGSGGSGGALTINATGTVTTTGEYSDGFVGQSIGGGGGKGHSTSGLEAIGGSAGDGGDGGEVTATFGGTIQTSGDYSDALYLQSIGGGGGKGSTVISTGQEFSTALGGSGGSGGDGGAVSATLGGTVTTSGDYSDAFYLQSIGGGGGKGANAISVAGEFSAAIGGSGGSGGDGGAVSATLGGSVTTSGDFSDVIILQSIGGGGGKGAGALSVGGEFSTAIGGNGGSGGDGGEVTLTSDETLGPIVTEGDFSSAVVLQSIGGGGGSGGYAISASAGIGIDASVGSGGAGDSGGHGAAVSADLTSNITTNGDNSMAIQAQSIGGGGGNGGMSISSANTNGLALSTSIGGKGGGGGNASTVTVSTSGEIVTEGSNSTGLMAQSIGGGGGSSGMSIDANAVSNWSLSAAVGRSGGAGGNAGDVTVSTASGGYVATTGASSDAIVAHSIGGNGGYAGLVVAATGSSGNAAIDLAIGGAGGAGGDGGDVIVNTSEGATTEMDGSIGINAQSIGGGGGHGAMAISGSLSSTSAINLAIGGSGGGGGNGGDVTVNADGSVFTMGDNGIGILAKSVGGSGGTGGISIAGDGLSNGTATISLSGNGGSGHASGHVKVNSTNVLQTQGMYATGIKAMSIGGGGGSATAAISGTTSTMGQAAVTVGGSGGSGGTGGDVDVTNSNQVRTWEDYSDAIYASSQGGSGGHGAFSAAGSLSAGEYSATTGVTLGGGGGGGGKSGEVSVSTSPADGGTNTIQTSGYQSRGILATSIGGNGGQGGSAYSGALTFSSEVGMDATVAVGGDGGNGAQGNTVTIDNLLHITTAGHYSDGILAQSIGGDGGIAGNAVAAGITFTQNSSANFETAVGGSGGDGSTAGDVDITNSGKVSTVGLESHGIYAQSVGGGGGRGGNAGTAIFDYTSSQQGSTDKTIALNVATSVGGTGGTGGHGGKVTVENDGAITVGHEANDEDGNQVADRMAYGIFAQSIGGGGGDGGSVSAYNMSVSGACTFNQEYLPSEISCDTGGGDSEASPKTTYAPKATIEIGGNGANGGDGDAVEVTNTGTISTSGTGSYGIFAQSTGGGGGIGGNGGAGLEYILPDGQYTEVLGYIETLASKGFSNSKSMQSVSLIVGGQGGSGGDGGSIDVTNSGSVQTSGFGADAIQALSTGGGGGNGGTAYTGLGFVGSFAVGGTGSGGGNGGAITIDSTGSVQTTGIDAMGIFAQSVGGGGGRAGAVSRALVGEFGVDLNVGLAVGGTLKAGDGGHGGDIDVTVGSSGLSTTGIRSHGVWAQSVGGSGGASSWGGGIEDAENEAISLAGGGGDYGSGGDVSVTVDGALSVSGISAVGVFGQSVSGSAVDADGGQKAGDVTATINGSVIATGEGGRGLFLQSEGYDSNGTITVNVASNGGVSADEDTLAAILIAQGNSKNTIENYGSIIRTETGSDAVTGYALKSFEGMVTVHNYNTVLGSVSLSETKSGGSSVTNVFNNLSGAYLGLGNTFDLGSLDSQLNNYGMMSAGVAGGTGEGVIGSSTFTGALDQSSTGSILVHYNFSGDSDYIDASSGTVSLEGQVLPTAVEDLPSNEESGTLVFFTGPAGISASSLTVTDTATVDYGISQMSDGSGKENLLLSYDVNYAAWEAEPETTLVGETNTGLASSYSGNSNLYEVVDYIDILTELRNDAAAVGSTEFENVDDFVFPLLALEEVGDVVEVYEHFSSGDILRLSEASVRSSYTFSNKLMSCPEQGEDGIIQYQNEGTCSWLSIGGQTRDADTNVTSISYDETVWSISGGSQIELSDGWFLGGGLSYEDVGFSTSISNGNAERYHVGAVLKKEIGNHTFALTLSGGHGDYDLHRDTLSAYGVASGKDNIENSWVSMHGRYSQYIAFSENTFVEPYIDFGVTRFRQDSAEVLGGLPFHLDVESASFTQYSVNPGIEFGQTLDTENGPIDMRLGIGFLGLFGNDYANEVSAVNHAATAGTFQTTADFDDRFVELKARISGRLNENTTMQLSAGALLGENDQTFGADLKLSYRF